jgi:hypothetical protein
MAVQTQHRFEFAEIITALIKHHDIRSGKWTLTFELGFGGGFYGNSLGEVKPGAMVQIQRLVLSLPGTPPPPAYLIVDAAIANPVVDPPQRPPQKSPSAKDTTLRAKSMQ